MDLFEITMKTNTHYNIQNNVLLGKRHLIMYNVPAIP